eukprot:s6034_g3.t1
MDESYIVQTLGCCSEPSETTKGSKLQNSLRNRALAHTQVMPTSQARHCYATCPIARSAHADSGWLLPGIVVDWAFLSGVGKMHATDWSPTVLRRTLTAMLEGLQLE